MLFEFNLFLQVGQEAIRCIVLVAKAFVLHEKELGIWYDHKWKLNGNQFEHLDFVHHQLHIQKEVFSCFKKFHLMHQTFIRPA